MIIAHVEFQRMEIDKFSLKDGVNLKIFFNDGNNKALEFHTVLSNVEDEAHNIVTKVRKYEKELNQAQYPGDSFLDNFVNVIIKDEEASEKKILGFLTKIKDRQKQVSGSRMASGYLDMVNQVRSLKMDF